MSANNSPFIVSSSRRTVSMGFVVVGAIVIIVPFIASFALDVISFLALVLDPVVCISVVDNIMQIFFVSILTMLN
jgi:hypothetical protein